MKVLPSGIQVGGPAKPAPPRPPPRPPALSVSNVMGCFWANAEAARRIRMLNFVIVAIVAMQRHVAPARRAVFACQLPSASEHLTDDKKRSSVPPQSLPTIK